MKRLTCFITILNMQRLSLMVVLFLLADLPPASASTRLFLLADQDMTVSEMHPDSPQLQNTQHTLNAGVGRGGSPVREGRSSSYLRFNLSTIPKAGWFENVSIDAAKLHLFVLTHALTPEDQHFIGKRYFVNVSSCVNSDWSESTMTWETRVCQAERVSQDTKIIDGDTLPAPSSWDVTQEFGSAVSAGLDYVTLIVDSQRLLNCSRDPLEGRGCPDVEQVGFLRFASRERVNFGLSVVPRVVLTYSEHPTSFMQFASSMLAVLSAMAMLVGLYSAVESFRKRKGKGHRRG